MELQARLDQDLKTALKNRDAVKISVLRLLKSALSYKQIDKGSELTDGEAIEVIDKQVKTHQESITAYRGRRDDLADQEQTELELLQTYLPAGLSDEELTKIVDQTLASIDQSAPFGQIMGMVMGKLKGQRVDGNKVRALIERRLNKN